MPICNAGQYLDETLKTVFAQSFSAFELICVDDSSNDELTRNILYKYQNQHENMQVIWLESNVGAGKARNIGFSKAKGEYTIFLDADDLFAEQFLEKMYQCIIENHADICICGYEEFYTDGKKKYLGNRYIPDDYKIYYDNREDWLLNIPMAPWNKLCKTQFLKESKIYFQSLASCNDVFFSCMVLMTARKKCYVADIPLVFYRINSIMQISSRRNPVDLYRAIILICNSRKIDNNDGRSLQWVSALLLQHGINAMRNSHNEIYNQQFYDLLRKYFMQYSIAFQNNMFTICVENIINYSYKNEWIFECTDFLTQLRLTAKKLKEKIGVEKQIFLWGLGYRGGIFEKFCKEQGIALYGVTDIKDEYIGDKTDYGNEVVSTKYVLQSDGLVIATNADIYQYLYMLTVRYRKKLRLLNLGEFYAF